MFGFWILAFVGTAIRRALDYAMERAKDTD